MARQRFNFTPPNTHTSTVFRDLYGNTILEMGYDDFMIVNPNGSTSHHMNNSYIQLVCGTQWNPAMLRAKPPVLIGVCQDCRYPPPVGFRRDQPTHGLVSLNHAKLCECGKLCCPRHILRCSDGESRCWLCGRRFRRRSFLLSLFFTRKEG